MNAKLIAFNTDKMAYIAHRINVAGCRAELGRMGKPSQSPAAPSQNPEGTSGAPGTAGVPSFGSKAGHSSSGRTENPRTPTAGPTPPKVEETAYDESHEPTFNYGHFAGGSSAWTNHMAGAYAGKGADRVDPSKTVRLDPDQYDQIRTRRRNVGSTPYVNNDRTQGYRTDDGHVDYFSA